MNLKDLINHLQELEDTLEEIKEDKARAYHDTEHSHNKERSDSAFNNYCYSDAAIEETKAEYARLTEILVININKVSNSKHRRILKRKLIDKQTTKEIASDMCYSYGYMCSIISDAEKALQKQLENNI